MAAVNPYLNFGGKTEEAFNFYRSAFGAEFQTLVRFRDMAEACPTGPEDADKIMHVALPIGEGTLLMGSDTPSHFPPPNQGNNISISISTRSEEESDKIFNALSAGGQVTMPLQKAPWNSYFGMLTDKYGIQWMVNYSYQQPEQTKLKKSESWAEALHEQA